MGFYESFLSKKGVKKNWDCFTLQVSELEHNLEPKKEKLEADRRSTQKYDEKVNEWKV